MYSSNITQIVCISLMSSHTEKHMCVFRVYSFLNSISISLNVLGTSSLRLNFISAHVHAHKKQSDMQLSSSSKEKFSYSTHLPFPKFLRSGCAWVSEDKARTKTATSRRTPLCVRIDLRLEGDTLTLRLRNSPIIET
jgi:hypothetical protein